jgi:hypothetical protein
MRSKICLNNDDCPNTLFCQDKHCQDPCKNNCGLNALCKVKNHQHHCYCPPQFTGNPKIKCSELECIENTECPSDKSCIDNVCRNICDFDGVCGPNSECVVENHFPVCRCLDGFTGDPRFSCNEILDCINNNQCPSNTVCLFGTCTGMQFSN